MSQFQNRDAVLVALIAGEITKEQALAAFSALETSSLVVKANPEKGTVSVYGLQRQPITLYPAQWRVLLNGCPDTHPVIVFLNTYAEYLPAEKGKAAAKPVPAELIGDGKPFRIPQERDEDNGSKGKTASKPASKPAAAPSKAVTSAKDLAELLGVDEATAQKMIDSKAKKVG